MHPDIRSIGYRAAEGSGRSLQRGGTRPVDVKRSLHAAIRRLMRQREGAANLLDSAGTDERRAIAAEAILTDLGS